MRADPTVMITCDECYDEWEIPLTALANRCYDERDVDGKLEREGWTKDGDRDLCAECSESDE